MKTQEALERVKKAFLNFDENEWKMFLSFCSKFHSYSWNNRILIYLQKPQATLLKGYRSWQKMGRQVKRGEKGVWIFAPMSKKEVKNGVERMVIKGFRVVSVFDISQTEGDEVEIPSVISGIKGEVSRELIEGIIESSPVEITFKKELIAHGLYSPSEKKIEIKEDGSKQMFKTILHELSHYYHHQIGWEEENDRQKEFIAESSACAVASIFGVDTSEYSVMYLKSWLDDFEQFEKLQKKLKKVIDKVAELFQLQENIA